MRGELTTVNDILDSLRFQIEWYDYVLNNRLCDDANKVLVYEGIRQALQSFVTRIVTAKEKDTTTMSGERYEDSYLRVLNNIYSRAKDDLELLLARVDTLTPKEREDMMYLKGRFFAAAQARDYYIGINKPEQDTTS